MRKVCLCVKTGKILKSIGRILPEDLSKHHVLGDALVLRQGRASLPQNQMVISSNDDSQLGTLYYESKSFAVFWRALALGNHPNITQGGLF